MANPLSFIKKATTVLTATATLFAMLRENLEIKHSLDSTIAKLKQAANSRSAKVRFDAKLLAIEAAADTAEKQFGATEQAADWRRAAAALRTRGELIWHANEGKQRRQGMKALMSETTALLDRINHELTNMSSLTQKAIGDAS